MALGDRVKEFWARATGNEPKPESSPIEQRVEPVAAPPEKKPADVRRDRQLHEGPAERFVPSHQAEMKEASREKPPAPEKPSEVIPSQMRYTMTAQPAPTPGGMENVQYVARKGWTQQQEQTPATDQAATVQQPAKDVKIAPVTSEYEGRRLADNQQRKPGEPRTDQVAPRSDRQPGDAPAASSQRQADWKEKWAYHTAESKIPDPPPPPDDAPTAAKGRSR